MAALALSGAVAPAFSQQPVPALPPLAPPVKIQVGTVGVLSDAPLYIAIERGYFGRLGIDIELQRFRSAGQMVPALGSNQLDVAGGSVAAATWNAEARNVGIRAVADKGSVNRDHEWIAWAVRKDSDLQTCADLKGKQLAAASTSNSSHATLGLWLAQCGLTVNDLGSRLLNQADSLLALQNNAVDLINITEPNLSRSLLADNIRILFHDDEVKPNEQMALILFSPGLVANRAVGERFMVAYLQGIVDYREAYANGSPPAPWLVDILKKYTGIQDEALYEALRPVYFNRDGRMNRESLKVDFDWFRKEGLILSDSVGFEDVLDDSFVDFARQHVSDTIRD